MLIDLAWRSLWNRRVTALLCVLTLSISVMLLLGVEKVREDMRRSFFNTVAGTDLIVGARSGQVELLLYSVFHLGSATNNIRWKSYQQIAADPAIAWSVPLSLGDSHRGYRVVGTTPAFFQHYRYASERSLNFASGQPFGDLHQVTLGAEVARTLGYKLGDKIVVSHGLGSAGLSQHKDQPFEVTGILQPTGTPVDRSLLVSLESITAIHLGWRAGVPLPGLQVNPAQLHERDLTPKQITAFMLGLKSKTAVFHLQRAINDFADEPLLAILPGVALQELWRVVGSAEQAMLAISACVVAAGLAGMLGVLLTSLQQRRHELALLRAVGATPLTLLWLMLLESLVLTGLGIVLGTGCLWLLLLSGADWLSAHFGLYLTLSWPAGAWPLLGAVLIAGASAGLVPALHAWRYTLADGLTPKL